MPLFSFGRAKADAEGFFETNISADEVHEGTLVRAQAGTSTVLITRYQNQLFAFSNVCPHAAADLGKGRLARGQIKCPDHSYTFDIRSGRPVWPPDEVCRLSRYTVKVEEGQVRVRLEAPPGQNS